MSRNKTQRSNPLFLSIKNLFQSKLFPKKNKEILNSSQNKFKKSSTMGQSKEDPKYKIFQPKKDYFIKSQIKENFRPRKKNEFTKKFKFGYKSLSNFTTELRGFNMKDFSKNFNYYLVKFRVLDQFNRFMSYIVLGILSIFIFYISFFDTFFLVKTYSVNFAQGSYIDETKTAELIDNIHKDKFLGLIPNNSLWFLNGSNLTLTAKKFNTEVDSIKVQNRIWPNQAIISVTTEPILLTLGINGDEYWRISKTGKVVSQDTAKLRENLVVVDKPVIFDKSNTDLSNYSFVDNKEQLNRFWFIKWLWRNLDAKEISYNKTTIPSLIDTDVIITTTSGTELLFDINTTTKNNHLSRLDFFLNQEYTEALKEGQFQYIDFRIPRRIFLCKKNQACANDKQ
ncbi:hypothetical protein HC864_01540 [Candidatus Gracilibacteria bacterium]|nr:hypothetical protein [Candidatus Gracilibacteria bacterium]